MKEKTKKLKVGNIIKIDGSGDYFLCYETDQGDPT